MDYSSLKDRLASEKEIYIFGAGIVAYGAYAAVRELFGTGVKAYLVSDTAGNPEEIDGVPVIKAAAADKKTPVLVAVPEEYHAEISAMLDGMGFEEFYILTSHLEYCLMGEYLHKTAGLLRVEDFEVPAKSADDIFVAMAVSHADRELAGKYNDPAWVRKVQVGAALTERRITELHDNSGDNISLRNSLYGELTAAYWMSRNEKHNITGLFHYRRVLEVSGEQLSLLQDKTADVILPLPFVCFPDTSGQYGRYLTKEDTDIMLSALKESDHDFYGRAEKALSGKLLYNYNMMIARKEVYEDYCNWMFPLLFEIEERCEKLDIPRLPRYIGRVGEVLTALYFLVNDKELKIIHGEKTWRI